MWTSNLTHICWSVGLSWLSLKRTAHPDQTDLTLVVPVLGTGEETPLVVRGVKESQTEGWWESGTRVWHSAAQKLYKIITPHFHTILEKSKLTTGEQRTVRFSKIFLTPLNNYRLRLLLDHLQYLYTVLFFREHRYVLDSIRDQAGVELEQGVVKQHGDVSGNIITLLEAGLQLAS